MSLRKDVAHTKFCLKNLFINKNALSSVESRVFVDTIRSDEANRARAFVTLGGGSAYKRDGDARRARRLA